jgi:Na+/H+-dicarboxylate symporter
MKYLKSLYFWIFMAFIAGITLGIIRPQLAVLMEPLGLNFIKLVKVFIGPIVFLSVATGIAQTGSLKKLGKIGIKAFLYFEVVSTIALLLGWAAASLLKPGTLAQANLQFLNRQPAINFLASDNKTPMLDFIQNLIPSNIVEPFLKGDILQILIMSILFGIALLGAINPLSFSNDPPCHVHGSFWCIWRNGLCYWKIWQYIYCSLAWLGCYFLSNWACLYLCGIGAGGEIGWVFNYCIY